MADIFWPSLSDYADIYGDRIAPLPNAGLGPVTNTTRAGRPNPVLQNTSPERPSDAMATVAQTLADMNPLAAAYMAGHAAGQSGLDLYQGNVASAGGNALLAAFMMPGLRGPAPRHDIGAKEAELTALRDHPRDARDVRFPARPEIAPEPWSAPPLVDDIMSTLPVSAPIAAGATAAIGPSGDGFDDPLLAFAGGAVAGIAGRAGYNAMKRNMPPKNAGAIAASDAAYADSLDNAIAGQRRTNDMLLQEHKSSVENMGHGPTALPPPMSRVDSSDMRDVTFINPEARIGSQITDAQIARTADPRTPFEKPNPQAQRRAEAEMRYQNSSDAQRMRNNSRAEDVERFARNFDNPEELARNLRLFSEASGMSIDDVVQAMRDRGLRVQNLPQHTVQKRDRGGRFQKLDPEAREYLNAIRRRDREQGGN